MQRLTCIHILCGLTLLLVSGCYHNTPYGYNSYPGVYSAPPVGGGFVPQGATILPPGHGDPNAGGGTFQQDQWAPTQANPTPADDVPVYDGAGDNTVPDYSTPGTDFSDPGTFEDQSGSEPPMGDFSYKAPRQPYSASPAQIQLTGASNQYLPPINANTAPEVHTAERFQIRAQNEASPCDYDKRHFRWLRGLADYNAENGTWNLIYNLNPDQNDPYGGSFTLVQDPRLEPLKQFADQKELVLLVEGYIDAKVSDSSGKPSFRVEHLSRLRRKAN